MKQIRFIICIFAMMATMPIFQSCMDDNDTPSDLLVISSINTLNPDSKDFYFTLDNGEKMFPSNGQRWQSANFADGQRAFVIFSELESPVNGYEHHVEVKQIKEILTKDIITMDDEDNNEDKIGDDKINATEMWINKDKKHLTIEFQYYGTNNIDKKHLLNLVINNPTASEDDEYINLEFRHNSEGDYPLTLGEGYVSFKLDGIKEQMEGKKGLRIRVNTLYEGIKEYEVEFP